MINKLRPIINFDAKHDHKSLITLLTKEKNCCSTYLYLQIQSVYFYYFMTSRSSICMRALVWHALAYVRVKYSVACTCMRPCKVFCGVQLHQVPCKVITADHCSVPVITREHSVFT